MQGLRTWAAQGRRFTVGAPWVALSKFTRKWDRLGKGYDTYSNVSWADICNYMRYDLFYNDIFVLGGQVMRQRRGVAMGGMCSAQSASIYCMQREDHWHQQQAETRVPWDQGCTGHGHRRRVPLSLHARPYRFRDNMVGVRSGKSTIESVRLYFQKVLGVELQVEGEGFEWTNLEACMRVQAGKIHLYMKKKMTWDTPAHKRLLRFPDSQSPNARTVLQSLVPALCQKGLFYASHIEGAMENLRYIIYELDMKGYPSNWWVPQMHRVLHMHPQRLLDMGIDRSIVDSTHILIAELSGTLGCPRKHAMGHAHRGCGRS